MTTVSPGLIPATVGLAYNARTNLRTASPPKTPSVFRDSVLEQERTREKLKSPTLQAADAKLSVIEVENMIRERIQKRPEQLLAACQNYDVDQSLSITKGEFRRVMETYCMPVTTEQFTDLLNKIPANGNGTVRYADFMEKFGADPKRLKAKQMAEKWNSGSQRYIRAPSPKERNGDMIEKMLREKIQNNLKNVLKGLRLYDYNRDGHIQKHELRKVLENNCFRMSDTQYDKLYTRYDFHHRGSLNYREFLQRLGVQLEEPVRPATSAGASQAFKWQEYADQQRKAITPQLGIDNRPAGDAPNYTTHPGAKLGGMALHGVEVEFRKKMLENYVDIKRMFMAFDKYNDGFIHLPDLAAILSQFTIPMSNQLFSQLMDRCGVKANGKISWEYFLEKFQDPQSHGNGQTITIKPAHKFNPIRGDNEAVSLPELVKLLVDQVQNGYASLKEAFLEIDKNRDGKITRKELAKVLRGFQVRVEDRQLKRLYAMLDPNHTNFISYHRFLDLFEERETKEGHKWLKSCHRYNDRQKPIIMAWETIEEILRNKIQDNWRDFSASLVNHDDNNTQTVSTKDLRRCLERYTIPVSTEHFDHMLSLLGETSGNKVNYVEFLHKLGVTVKPGDQQGLSTQIHEASNEAEGKRVEEQTRRLARGEMRALDKTDHMSADEIIARLKDKAFQKSSVIRSVFLKYDVKKTGKITKKNFRQVLEKFGFNMSDTTFETLCAKLSFEDGKMSYTDFVTNFEDPRPGGPAAELMKDNNHRVNPIRGDTYGMTVLEVESKLRNKLRANFEDLRVAFYKFDDNHDGLLTKGNFRRMLDAFMCIMGDEEFEKLCQRLEITNKSRIDYKKFLEKFEVRDSEEGHKWLVSDHRFNETNPAKMLTADEVHKALSKKAHQQFADLSKAFCVIDGQRDGMIRKDGLRKILDQFILPMSKDEFKKLWAMYDTTGKGHITHADFLKHLVGDEFAPSDLNGFSYSVIKESYRKLDKHHKDQQRKQEIITVHQAERVGAMDVDTILQQLKDRIREQYDDFYAAFKKYDSQKVGYLTANSIQKILTDFNYFLDDDQFYDLLGRLNLHGKRRLSYSEFLEVLQEGRKDNYKSKPPDVTTMAGLDSKSTPEAALAVLHDKVSSQIEVLTKAFTAFDQRGLGFIPQSDFRRILDNFCYKLTDPQFKHLLTKLPSNKEGDIDYRNYVESFKMSEVDADKWIQMINRRLRAETPGGVTEEEVTSYLKEQVASKYHHLAKAFSEIDYARIGVVTRDDFRNLLNNQNIRVNDEQFDKLWASLSVNEFGNLDYTDFLRKFTSDVRPTTSLPPTPLHRSATSIQLGRLSVASVDRRSVMSRSGPARSFTPMVNAENVERRLKDAVCRNWKEIQRYCREADTDNTKQISYDAFKHIMKQLGGALKDADMNTLFLKYDLNNNNHFCYNDFLRQFVLVMQPQREATSLLNRKKADPPKVSTPPSPGEPADALTRARQCVALHWKDMRRQFAKFDTTNSSTIPADDMRQVLRNFKLNLDEGEFQNLMAVYDTNMDGQVNYNNFIRAFIHTQ